MALEVGGVTMDCSSVAAMAAFWCAALGYEVQSEYGDFIFLHDPLGRGPTIGVQHVPEPRLGKNRLHLDLQASDREQEVARLIGLGAREIDRHRAGDFEWVVMADPEGHEFCVAPAG